jgi:hypothetical protein
MTPAKIRATTTTAAVSAAAIGERGFVRQEWVVAIGCGAAVIPL